MQCGKDGAKSHVGQTGGGGLVSVVLLLCVEFMYRFLIYRCHARVMERSAGAKNIRSVGRKLDYTGTESDCEAFHGIESVFAFKVPSRRTFQLPLPADA